MVDLDPIRGHEQGGRRPALVLSIDAFNGGPAGLVVALPITSRIRPMLVHVLIQAGEAGLPNDSVVLCEQVRVLSQERCARRVGQVSLAVMAEVESRVRMILGL